MARDNIDIESDRIAIGEYKGHIDIEIAGYEEGTGLLTIVVPVSLDVDYDWSLPIALLFPPSSCGSFSIR